ncbi:hypothetical protein [Acinetobacter bouvetii]|nr:hypothetical protein [Acinetobacter bouvetii]
MFAMAYPQSTYSAWNALDIQVCKADARRVDFFNEVPCYLDGDCNLE